MNTVQIINTLAKCKETFYIYLSTKYNSDWDESAIGDIDKLDTDLMDHLNWNKFSCVITLMDDNERKDISFVYRDGCLHKEESTNILALICTPNVTEKEIIKTRIMNRDKEITYLNFRLIEKRQLLESLKRYCTTCDSKLLPVELNVCSQEDCKQLLCDKHSFRCGNCDVYLCAEHMKVYEVCYIYCDKCFPE